MEKACNETSILMFEIQKSGIQTPIVSPAELERVGFKIVLYSFGFYTTACGMSEDTKLQGKFMFAVPE
jgi:hypothetical protein